MTNNFSLKPIKLSIFAATAADLAAVPDRPRLASQRTVADFRQPTIKADRALRSDPAYVPAFARTPIRKTGLPLRLDDGEYAALQRLKRGDLYGDSDGDALRDILFSRWRERFATRPHVEK